MVDYERDRGPVSRIGMSQVWEVGNMAAYLKPILKLHNFGSKIHVEK